MRRRLNTSMHVSRGAGRYFAGAGNVEAPGRVTVQVTKKEKPGGGSAGSKTCCYRSLRFQVCGPAAGQRVRCFVLFYERQPVFVVVVTALSHFLLVLFLVLLVTF